MIGKSILVVDDEPDICSLIKEILEDEGFRVTIAENGSQATTLLKNLDPQLILLDIWMPDIDGISLLKEWKESNDFNIPVVMMSGHGTVETAVEATRLGAYDFLEKPLSLAKLILTVKNVIETTMLQNENRRLRNVDYISNEIIGKSEVTEILREQIKKIADLDTPVMVIGKPGSDKETVARYIHNNSHRQEQPFVPVNISALSPDDASVELFGKVVDGKVQTGYIDDAEGGTLFLKDILNLDYNTQAKLHNAIEKKTITRTGDIDTSSINVRIIAATLGPLDNVVKEGRFHDDLYFQLSVIPIYLPPLRDHIEDVSDLLEYFVNFFVEKEGLPYRHFTTSAQNRLRQYPWPGNIRELKNFVQRMLILGHSNTVELDEVIVSLGDQPVNRADDDLHNFDIPLREARGNFEKSYLKYQMKQTNGNVSKIARITGMERTHLYRKLKSLGIEIKN